MPVHIHAPVCMRACAYAQARACMGDGGRAGVGARVRGERRLGEKEEEIEIAIEREGKRERKRADGSEVEDGGSECE